MPSIVPFRLRVGKDEDLEAAFETVPSYIEKSDIIREALRMYFFDAPTPLRDNLGYFEQTLSKPRALPREPKAKQQVQPQLDKPKMDIDFTSVVPVPSNDNDLESKLNKSLGF